MRTVALRVAFDGAAFAGSQRQPDARTVDGDLLRAFAAIGAGPSAFRASSRTDAGVSAAGYVVAVDTEFRPDALCAATTAQLRDAWCTAWAEAPAGFDPRRAASRRWYRYFLAEQGLDAQRFAEALAQFVGEHDFSAFARVEAHRSPRRTVHRAVASLDAGLLTIDVEGPSFLWNQVRRMVAAAAACARGEAEPATLREALSTGRGPDLGVAPAAGLVLMEVDVGLPWREAPAVAGRLGEAVQGEVERARQRALVLASLTRDPHEMDSNRYD